MLTKSESSDVMINTYCFHFIVRTLKCILYHELYVYNTHFLSNETHAGKVLTQTKNLFAKTPFATYFQGKMAWSTLGAFIHSTNVTEFTVATETLTLDVFGHHWSRLKCIHTCCLSSPSQKLDTHYFNKLLFPADLAETERQWREEFYSWKYTDMEDWRDAFEKYQEAVNN